MKLPHPSRFSRAGPDEPRHRQKTESEAVRACQMLISHLGGRRFDTPRDSPISHRVPEHGKVSSQVSNSATYGRPRTSCDNPRGARIGSTRLIARKPASALTLQEAEHHSPELKAAGSNPAGRTKTNQNQSPLFPRDF